MRRSLVPTWLMLFPLLFALQRDAAAEDTKARALFEAGAKAYREGNDIAAIQAFEEAYQQDPRPGLLFSLGQSHRRAFTTTHDRKHLDSAIEYYRGYVERARQGQHRPEAITALSQLEAMAKKLPQEPPKAAAVDAPARPTEEGPRETVPAPQPTPPASAPRTPEPREAAAPSADMPRGAPPGSSRSTSDPMRGFVYVGLGLGAAGITTGSILGIMAIAKKNGLKTNCPEGLSQCPPEQTDDINS